MFIYLYIHIHRYVIIVIINENKKIQGKHEKGQNKSIWEGLEGRNREVFYFNLKYIFKAIWLYKNHLTHVQMGIDFPNAWNKYSGQDVIMLKTSSPLWSVSRETLKNLAQVQGYSSWHLYLWLFCVSFNFLGTNLSLYKHRYHCRTQSALHYDTNSRENIN